jgi:UDP-glucose 4-epimerase
MQKRTVLIVGGAGFIGSHVNKMLLQKGYSTIVYDNLSRGNKLTVEGSHFIKGDISDSSQLDKLFQIQKIDAVMHFAALIDVGESVIHPSRYYTNNVSYTLNLLNTMLKHNVKTFIFSSTAAVYGTPNQSVITEEHPTHPINPYGETKLAVEKILRDFDHAYQLRSCSFRYFNAAGGDPEGKIKYYQLKPNNLIPIVLRNIKDGSGPMKINGTDYATPDGTCVRDYVHIEDLASAHIIAMEKLWNGAPTNIYNLGNGHGFSVKEVIAAAEKVTGKKVHAIEGPRRPGDPAILVADAHKAEKELGWIPQYRTVETMIEHAWKALI